MLRRKHVILLGLIMLMSLSYIPSEVSSSVGTTAVDNLMEKATPTEILPRNIRVAVYDEPNETTPDWGSVGYFTNDSTHVAQVLGNAGYDVELLGFQDLLEDRLVLSNFDVFVMPDNLPRENVTMLAKSFWLSGGGLLTIDSSASFLGYAGIIPYESEGDDGRGTYWNWVFSELQVVSHLHPATKSFSVGDQFNITLLNWATFNWTALMSTQESSHYVKLSHAQGDTNAATGIAYEPELRGGRVVQLPGYAQNTDNGWVVVEETETMWVDAIKWLCPTPKSRIAFDLSHKPKLGFDPWDEEPAYPDFLVDLRDHLVTHSFTVDKLYPSSEGNLTANRLAPYDILALVAPDYNYTSAERTSIESWVDSGGSLLVLGEAKDAFEFAKPTEQLNAMVDPFGMEITEGSATVKGDVVEHPIRDRAETVQFGLGGYINITGHAFPLVMKDGNIHVAATEYGAGRVIVSADINWADKNHFASEDNTIWALNIANWLGATGADTLLYSDDLMADDYYETPPAKALNELGIDYFLVTWDLNLNLTLDESDWEHVIVDAPTNDVDESVDYLINHVENEGYLAMHCYNFDNPQFEPLLNMMGVSFANNYPLDSDFYMWNENHPIYSKPIDFGGTSFSISGGYSDDGDLFHVFENATGIGGSSATPQNNKSALAVRKDRKTIAMGYIFDQIDGDGDGSGYADSFEIWVNTISYFFSPSIDSPPNKVLEVGTLGEFVTWHPSSYRPERFIILENGVEIENALWNGGNIGHTLDGYETGMYEFTLIVIDAFNQSAFDKVLVVIEDTTVPSLDSPSDVEFTEGQTGNFVNWTASDEEPDAWELLIDGSSNETGTWSSGGEISFNVDRLEVGSHNLTLLVEDQSGNIATDTVIVTVLEEATTDTTTTGTGPETTTATSPTGTGPFGLPDSMFGIDTWIVLAGAGAVVLLLIIVIARRK